MKRRCDIPGCEHEATWRQYDPVEPKVPVYLCMQHWNETRILDPDRSMTYGPARLFPEGDCPDSP